MRNHSYENNFYLHEKETACRTHFHMKGFALRLALKQRHKRTRKWPIRSKEEQIRKQEAEVAKKSFTCAVLLTETHRFYKQHLVQSDICGPGHTRANSVRK